MIKIRKYVEKLPVIDFGNNSVKIRVEKISMIASCDNRESPHTDLCNTRDSKIDVRVMADGFVYKIKYCAWCHEFVLYSQITLKLVHCTTLVSVAGIRRIEMTIPD